MDSSINNDKTTMAPEGGDRRYTLSAGQTLGQYRVVMPLGKGGMGEVYLVEHEILRTRHALKLLPAERAGSTGFLRRFRDEARVMARLQHSGIVHVQYADVSEGHHFLIMDFVACGENQEPFDLEAALASAPDGRLEPEVVARLATQICDAVGYAHAQGVVHRDLKPSNVLLTDRDLSRSEVRVTDFGLARLVGEDWLRSVIDASMRQSMSIGGMETMARPGSERSSSGSILGTYEYMSPEQREGSDVDHRSDIYALGVMLYRMVTGKRPMMRAKAASRIVEDLDEAWDELIDSCLEEDPSERPSSMLAVAASLAELLSVEQDRHEASEQETSAAERQGTDADRQRKADTVAREANRLQQEEAALRKRDQKAAGAVSSVDLGGGVKLDLVWVPPGSFMMGSPSSEADRDGGETRHGVTLSKGFWMGKYEVTQGQWQSVMGSNPSRFKAPGLDAPVQMVSWDDCQAFIKKVNAKVGGDVFRLPTEAEWEYACRAGTTTPFCYGSDLDASKANFDGNYPYGGGSKGVYRETTVRVGSFKPNSWGLYDMHGNVYEWCSDRFGNYPSGNAVDPSGPESGVYRVFRGGSWYSDGRDCRAANRRRFTPSFRDFDLGFRLVRTAPTP
jgi:sulfatase modifying factor 1